MSLRLPSPPLAYDAAAFDQAFRVLELEMSSRGAPAARGYVATGHTPTRALDAAAALADVRAVLGTLISDLKQKGILA